ncbi:uncharacterized protein [Rutidosis leptorrhynchoides]|uniref:uncharacterized protein n=1 Tax=Rutidosis leptorrhynchoides TaxID=125765 RepID=UPI003A9960DD
MRRYEHRFPYPQSLLAKHPKDAVSKSIQAENENICINLPLVEVLENMTNYGKFLKTLMAKKGECELASTAFLKRLGLGDLVPTKTRVKLIDQSISQSVGIAEDFIVKVGEMEFSADFVIVDLKEDPVVPLVLGRPFLATAGSLFDLRAGKLTLIN